MIIWNLLVVSGDFCETKLKNFINSSDFITHKLVTAKESDCNENYLAAFVAEIENV